MLILVRTLMESYLHNSKYMHRLKITPIINLLILS